MKKKLFLIELFHILCKGRCQRKKKEGKGMELLCMYAFLTIIWIFSTQIVTDKNIGKYKFWQREKERIIKT